MSEKEKMQTLRKKKKDDGKEDKPKNKDQKVGKKSDK